MSRLLFTLAAAATIAFGGVAFAEDGNENENENEGGFGAVMDPVTQAECSACHMAYPAQLLPQQSWRGIMRDLSNHFGEDASLDAKTARNIENYLVSNSARARGVNANNPPLRITEMFWFTREHGQRLRNRAAGNANIGSISNCVGCHGGAANGYFDD
ncbi:MAG: cytochrome C [Alphaproteobacteria bacterium]|nr:cytochrome C [Alphaproteobacteria bacterium]